MSGVGKIGKLVRDKIPDVILKSGKKCNYSVLTDGEYLTALKRKVVEEATEVAGADCNTKIIEELGDLLDVVGTIVMVCGLSMKDINSSRKTKNEKYGGFSGKIFLQEIHEEKDK